MDQAMIDGNTAATQRLRALVGQLNDEQLGQELAGGWTVAAFLAHVAFFDRRIVALLDRWTREEIVPSPIDVDAVNDAMLPQWRLIPPRVAADDALAVAEQTDRTVAAVSSEFLNRIQRVTDVPMDRARHRNAHLDEIERTLRH